MSPADKDPNSAEALAERYGVTIEAARELTADSRSPIRLPKGGPSLPTPAAIVEGAARVLSLWDRWLRSHAIPLVLAAFLFALYFDSVKYLGYQESRDPRHWFHIPAWEFELTKRYAGSVYFGLMPLVGVLTRTVRSLVAALVATIVLGAAAILFTSWMVQLRSDGYLYILASDIPTYFMYLFLPFAGGSAIGWSLERAVRRVKEGRLSRLTHLTELLALKERLETLPRSTIQTRKAERPLWISSLGLVLAGVATPYLLSATGTAGGWTGVILAVSVVIGLGSHPAWLAIIRAFLYTTPAEAAKGMGWFIASNGSVFGLMPDAWRRDDTFATDFSLVMVVSSAVFSAIGFGLARLRRDRQQELLIASGDRVAMVRRILELETLLKVREQWVSVLVVDAVRSAKMKLSVDALVAEREFRAYQAWIDRHCQGRSARVVARPGDGAIIAFSRAVDAVAVSRSLLEDLPAFNSESGRAFPFQIRLGIHGGKVMGDLTNVQFAALIDVAAHVQGTAAVDGIAVTECILDSLEGPDTISPLIEVDGFQTYSIDFMRDRVPALS
jgi:class 3 adenylate cyclase